MSVPPEVMQQMLARGGGGGAAAGGAPGGSPGQQAGAAPLQAASQGQTPAGSPTAQPQEKRGLKAAAMSNLHIAQNMIEQALTAFSPEDKEYKACLKCLNSLAPIAARNDSTDLVPAEVMRMVGQMPQMGGGTDVQRMILQQMKAGKQPQQPQPGQG